jgi:HsdM N-terminal domain
MNIMLNRNGSNFFSSGLRQKVDQLMDILYSGGVNNPMDSIEQISYLLFLRLLSEKDDVLAMVVAVVDPKAGRVLVPPLQLQREFSARVSEIRALEAQQVASGKQLDDLFQSMLHRAFNGEL